MTGSVAWRGDAQPAAANADVRQIHLDANANVPATRAVQAAVLDALELGGNPSSAHAGGAVGRAMLTAARDAVTTLCDGLFPEDVIFTSGCTEANNLVIASAQAAGATLITTAVEHPSVLGPAEAFAAAGGAVTVLPVDRAGRVDLVALAQALSTIPGPVVVSIQAANSETGVLQPLGEIARLATQRDDVLFHADAAQAFGKIRLSLRRGEGPDVFSVSGHKLHGPMGVGALLVREGEDRLHPSLRGGGQERGLRAGTQALPLIAGFSAACHQRSRAFVAEVGHMATLRDRFEMAICNALPQVEINGEAASRLANTSNMRFPDVDAMALLALLGAEGVLASQGSACHSARPEPSPVLMAMGLAEDAAFSSIRVSVSPLNTEAEIDAAAAHFVSACQRLGHFG